MVISPMSLLAWNCPNKENNFLYYFLYHIYIYIYIISYLTFHLAHLDISDRLIKFRLATSSCVSLLESHSKATAARNSSLYDLLVEAPLLPEGASTSSGAGWQNLLWPLNPCLVLNSVWQLSHLAIIILEWIENTRTTIYVPEIGTA